MPVNDDGSFDKNPGLYSLRVSQNTRRNQPVGQISRALIFPSSPICKNISSSRPTQITSFIPVVSSHLRGGSRSSRTRDGMRWTQMALITNGAKADGEDVWS
jgi:hypothetical protein